MQESLWEFFQEINWQMILLTLLAGGILSIIGDRVGMKIAKRRVSIFNIRPRYTSTILTAITGMTISLFVILVLSVVSENVRTSLFSIQFIQRQIVDLTSELKSSRDEQEVSSLLIAEAQQRLTEKENELRAREAELAELQSRAVELRASTEEIMAERDRLTEERATLEEDIKTARESLGRFQEGRIVAFAEERLGQEIIPEGIITEAEAKRILDRLNERVRYEVARRSDAEPTSIKLEPDDAALKSTLNRIVAYDSRKVIRAITPENIAVGEPVRITYRVNESTLVFSDGEPLITRALRTKPNFDQAEIVLTYLLRELNRTSQASGILNDPLTGSVGGIPANDFYDSVERIASARAPLRITVVADGDIYSEGPVTVKVRVSEKIPLPTIDPDEEHLPPLENLQQVQQLQPSQQVQQTQPPPQADDR